MTWFDASGATRSAEGWNDPERRTLQDHAASTPELEEFNRVLVVVHGSETSTTVTLPTAPGVRAYVALWTSGDSFDPVPRRPGELYEVSGPTVTLWRVS
jgi:glycogen operon protein